MVALAKTLATAYKAAVKPKAPAKTDKLYVAPKKKRAPMEETKANFTAERINRGEKKLSAEHTRLQQMTNAEVRAYAKELGVADSGHVAEVRTRILRKALPSTVPAHFAKGVKKPAPFSAPPEKPKLTRRQEERAQMKEALRPRDVEQPADIAVTIPAGKKPRNFVAKDRAAVYLKPTGSNVGSPPPGYIELDHGGKRFWAKQIYATALAKQGGKVLKKSKE